MAKTKTCYVCRACGVDYPKWAGQCVACGVWNQLQAFIPSSASTSGNMYGYAGKQKAELTALTNLHHTEQQAYIDSGLNELNRVLGGGLVAGGVVLIGGDPGVGKSTLLLQVTVYLATHHKVLYVTGEESLQQVGNRAKRLSLAIVNRNSSQNNADTSKSEEKLSPGDIWLLAETQVRRIIQIIETHQPSIVVIDSVQTLHCEGFNGSPGSVSQVRESCSLLVQLAKQTQTTLLLIGHVTKEGALAGPRVLEHMVDTVLYFEGQTDARFRMVRAIKNRFGAVNELGVFLMSDRGLREVNNPSALFLSHLKQPKIGSVVLATWEGTRPLLVEVQALVDKSQLEQPRRVVVGLENNRIAMLLAILNRHAGISSYRYDIFVNVVGGLRVTETAADLAILLAIASGLYNKALPTDLIIFGELGLSGEVRPVPSGQERLNEAIKQHYKHAIIPSMNMPPQKGKLGIELHPLQELKELFTQVMPKLGLRISNTLQSLNSR